MSEALRAMETRFSRRVSRNSGDIGAMQRVTTHPRLSPCNPSSDIDWRDVQLHTTRIFHIHTHKTQVFDVGSQYMSISVGPMLRAIRRSKPRSRCCSLLSGCSLPSSQPHLCCPIRFQAYLRYWQVRFQGSAPIHSHPYTSVWERRYAPTRMGLR